MHLKIRILEFKWNFKPVTLNSIRECGRDVEVQRVAELILTRCATRLDTGGHVARVVTSKIRLAQRSEKIAQCAVAKKVEALVGDLELHLPLLHFSGLSRLAGLPRAVER